MIYFKSTKVRGRIAFLLALLTSVAVLSFYGCSNEKLEAPMFGTSPDEFNVTSTPDGNIDYTLDFNGSEYTVNDTSVVAVDRESGALMLIKSGVYRLSGSRTGQIQISIAKQEKITLILDGLELSSPDSAAIYVKSADKVYIEAHEGTTNTISDGSMYDLPMYETKPNACIYSAEDLIIRGKGSINVIGNYNNAIGCKNDLTIRSCTLTVSALNNAIKGNDSVTVTDGAKLTVSSAEDAVKSDSTDIGKGYVLVDHGAELTLLCTDDAIQAMQSVTVTSDAKIAYACGGSPINCEGLDGTGGHVDVAEGSVYRAG